MPNKAAETTQYIVETVAPIFNKYGFVGTSMKTITDAVGMTKGAIYGNFENKESLAIAAFNYLLRKITRRVSEAVQQHESPVQQLYALTAFYRNYLGVLNEYNGCPILNISADANYQNPVLLQRVTEVIKKLEWNLANMIRAGIKAGEIRPEIDADLYGKRLYTIIQGAVFMTSTMQDDKYIKDMMDHLDQMIQTELVLN